MHISSKVSSVALVAGTAVSALAATAMPSAHAATMNDYVHVSSGMTSRAACQADFSAFKSKLAAAHGTLVSDIAYINSSNCFISDKGWTRVDGYYAPSAAVSTDSLIYSNPASPSTALLEQDNQSKTLVNLLRPYKDSQYVHSYTFGSYSDCMSHFNSVSNSLKSLDGKTVNYTAPSSSASVANNTMNTAPTSPHSCAPSNQKAGSYEYLVSYEANRTVEAPFGYEQVNTSSVYTIGGSNGYQAAGHTDPNGNYVLDRVYFGS